MNYFNLPFDPSGYDQLSSSQLAQLVAGISPTSNYGMVINTTDDVFGNPTVPSPIAIPLYAGFLWIRWGNASNGSATLYIWNPNAANSAVLLQWQIANISSITAGSITGSQIAALTITDGNIYSVGWAKLPSGAAVGGCLVGNMPNPSLANAIVGNTNMAALSVTGGGVGAIIAANTITDYNIALQGISYLSILLGTIHGADGSAAAGQLAPKTVASSNILGSNVANQVMVTDSVTPTQMDYVTVAKTLCTSITLDTGLATNQFKPVIANAAGNAYTYKAHDIIQMYQEANTNNFSVAYGNGAGQSECNPGTTPKLTATANVIVATSFGTGGVISFTPLSASSKIMIECDIVVANSTDADYVTVGLFQGTTLLTYNQIYRAAYGKTCRLVSLYPSGSTTTINFSIAIGPGTGGTAEINPDAGNQTSSVKITEYL